jgi:hypothetical protein
MLLATTLAWMADADINFSRPTPEPVKDESCPNQIPSFNVSVRGAESRLTTRFNGSETTRPCNASAVKLSSRALKS